MKTVSVLLGVAAIAAISMTNVVWAQDNDNQGPAPADSAAGQLDNATSGTQSTGQTFDGGNGPTDAYPDGTSDEAGSDDSSSDSSDSESSNPQ